MGYGVRKQFRDDSLLKDAMFNVTIILTEDECRIICRYTVREPLLVEQLEQLVATGSGYGIFKELQDVIERVRGDIDEGEDTDGDESDGWVDNASEKEEGHNNTACPKIGTGRRLAFWLDRGRCLSRCI